MATGDAGKFLSTSVNAAADLSTKQYYLMKIGTAGTMNVPSSRGERCHGVLKDDPSAANQAGELVFAGEFPVECGGTFEEGDPLTTDSSGKAIKATQASDVVIGTAKEPGASGARASIFVSVAGGALGDPQKIVVDDFENDYAAADDPAGIQADGTAASGTAGEVNLLYTKENVFGYAALGTQTITVPVVKTDAVNSLVGLDIGMDQTDDDGVNLWTSCLGASGHPFSCQNDAAFYALLKFSIQDVSGTDDFHFGFRGVEAPNAAFDDYNNAFGFHVNGTTLNIETIVGGAATTTTDTTDAMADAARTYTFKVLVSAAGVVTYQHDITTEGTLAAPTATAALTAAEGLNVIPFVFFLNSADVAGEVMIYKWEVGYQ